MSTPFVYRQPFFTCYPHDDPNNTFSCTPSAKYCSKDFIIAPTKDSPKSLIVEFSLYCDRAWLESLVKSLFFAFSSLSTLVGAYAADKYGRRPIIFITAFIGGVSFLLIPFTPNFVLFTICLVFAGFGSPFLTFSLILLNESGGKFLHKSLINHPMFKGELFRKLTTIGLLMSMSLGEMVTGFIVQALNDDWKNTILYGVGIPLFIMLFSIFWVLESPK